MRRPVSELHPHPRADVIPRLPDDEMATLVADIKARGLITPLDVLEDGTVLDGHHRLRAAQALGHTTVPVLVVRGYDSFTFMLKAALLRRHLDVGQRAMLALEIETYRQAILEARARKTASQIGANEKLATVVVNLPPPQEHAKSRDIAARAMSVSPTYVQRAKEVSDRAPDLAAEVKAGARTLHNAHKETRNREGRAVKQRENAPPKEQPAQNNEPRALTVSSSPDAATLAAVRALSSRLPADADGVAGFVLDSECVAARDMLDGMILWLAELRGRLTERCGRP